MGNEMEDVHLRAFLEPFLEKAQGDSIETEVIWAELRASQSVLHRVDEYSFIDRRKWSLFFADHRLGHCE
jgi:hypothetical protein